MTKKQGLQLGLVSMILISCFSLVGVLHAARDVSIEINGGESRTADRNVQISVTAPREANAMRFANTRSGLNDASWQDIRDTKRDWPLQGQNGYKTVYAQFRLDNGEYSRIYTDSIRLELEDEPQVTINEGDDVTTNQTVDLYIVPPPNARRMRISNTRHLVDARWRSLDDDVRWKLSDGNGKKYVYVQYQYRDDRLSNIYSATIRLDAPIEPEAQVSINNDNRETTSQRVGISLRGTTGYDEFRVSNSSNFAHATWQPVTRRTVYWTLPEREGSHTIYVEFRTEEGETKVVRDSIRYAPPEDIADTPESRIVRAPGDDRVYYIGVDGAAHPFPSTAELLSYVPDLRDIAEISASDLRVLPVGSPVCMRAGTWLVKFAGFSRVYAVEPGCTLRPLRSSVEAFMFYGSSWQQRIVTLPSSRRSVYTISTLSEHSRADDRDRDGLTGEEEREAGSSDQSADTDGDGVTDFEEVQFWGSNPAHPDSDADGVRDDQEIRAGTSPVGHAEILVRAGSYQYPVGTVVYDRWRAERYYYQAQDGVLYSLARKASDSRFRTNRFHRAFVVHSPYPLLHEPSRSFVKSNDPLLRDPTRRVSTGITAL